MTYETLSKNEFGLDQDTGFHLNVFVNISSFLESKIELLQIYKSEPGSFLFPRSATAVRALAQYRGVTAGFEAAEAFQLLRERG
jgi:hypothetical protein